MKLIVTMQTFEITENNKQIIKPSSFDLVGCPPTIIRIRKCNYISLIEINKIKTTII